MSMIVAIHFLSCLPQFCLHDESQSVVDMRTGATVSCLEDGNTEQESHLQVVWPGMSDRSAISIGAAKYLELQTSEASNLRADKGAFDAALHAALIGIGHEK